MSDQIENEMKYELSIILMMHTSVLSEEGKQLIEDMKEE